MAENVAITNVRLVSARATEQRGGLLGWVTLTVNDALRLDGLALRRTAEGRIALSFPARRDSAGQQHFYFRPLGDAARREIEHQVFEALGLGEGALR